MPEGKCLPNQNKCFECGFCLRNRTYSEDLKRPKKLRLFDSQSGSVITAWVKLWLWGNDKCHLVKCRICTTAWKFGKCLILRKQSCFQGRGMLLNLSKLFDFQHDVEFHLHDHSCKPKKSFFSFLNILFYVFLPLLDSWWQRGQQETRGEREMGMTCNKGPFHSNQGHCNYVVL